MMREEETLKYSVLLVDDEPLIRRGIRARLTWLGLPFERIAEAGSAAEALERLENETFDLLITDVRMPETDGLDLIAGARERCPSIRALVLSGYAEFEYARRALDLGVDAYLTKPVDGQELFAACTNALARLEQSRLSARETQPLSESRRREETYAAERELNLFFSGRDGGVSFPHLKTSCPFFWDGSRSICLGILRIDSESWQTGGFRPEDLDLLHFCLKNVLDEVFGEGGVLAVPHGRKRNRMYLVFSVPKSTADGEAALRGVAAEAFRILRETLAAGGVVLGMGVSETADALRAEWAEQAEEALSFVRGGAEDALVFFDGEAETPRLTGGGESASLELFFRERRLASIERLLDELCFDASDAPLTSASWRRIIDRVFSLLIRSGPSADEPERMATLIRSFERIRAMEAPEEIVRALKRQLADALSSSSVPEEIDSGSRIRMARNYIEQHYSEDLSVAALAERFGMRANYFSSRFKQEVGCSAVRLIATCRVRKACEYLERSDWSIVDIARRVGYEDPQYFFRVFKKEMGLSPLQYRNRGRG